MLGVGRPSREQGVHDRYMFIRIAKSLIPKRTRFRGHVDGISDGYMFGWLFDTKYPKRSVVFDLFVNGDYHGQWTCAFFRPDLLAGNFGNGVHGFKVPLPIAVEASVRDRVEIFVPAVGCWLATNDGTLCERNVGRGTRRTRLRLFQSRLERNATKPISRQVDAASIAATLSRSDVYKNERQADLQSSDFTEFLRRIMKWRSGDQRFYDWYINDYIYRLDRRFIPLSREEREFIKNFLELTRPDISRPLVGRYFRIAMWQGARSFLEVYRIYWWAIEGGRQLNLDYSILNSTEIEKLSALVPYGFGRSFPLTNFMLMFALRNGLVGALAMLFPSGRRRVYKWCSSYAQQNSHILRYIATNDTKRCESVQVDTAGSAVLGVNAGSEKQPGISETCPVQIIGPFDKLLGLGESSRRLMSAVAEVEPECNFVCYNDGIQSKSLRGSYNYRISRANINIIHLNLEQIPEFFLKNGDILKGAYNIVFPYWELSKLSSLHYLGVSLIDEVWTASSFVSALFDGRVLPVATIGLPAVPLPRASKERARRLATFTFLTTFDAFSWPQRKNALAVVEAFLTAFGNADKVRLIVKTQNAEHVHSEHQRRAWAVLKERCTNDSRIEIINETYSPKRQRELLLSCDCLVSLHRAEGLGIDVLDALASGIPVVATAYSGNMDICTDQNSWLVDYDLVPVREDEYVFVEEGQFWAEPQHCSAVSALQRVFSNERLRSDKASTARSDVQALRSITAVAEKISGRLRSIGRLRIASEQENNALS